MEKKLHDLVIIGASAAGSAAAIYAIRRNLDVIMLSKDIGGEVARAGEVENWPGIIHTTGMDLAKDFENHVKHYNVPLTNGFSVTRIEQVDNHHIVHGKDILGNEQQYPTKAVIIATGIHPRELGAEHEDALKGRGVTYCTVCDGPLFKGKTTATIGAGNAAVESALMMSGIAEKVYLVTKYGPDSPKGGFPKAEDILLTKVRALDNVEIIHNAETKKILGEGKVSGITYTDKESGEEKELTVDGVMVHIGVIPNSKFVDCVQKDQTGQILVDKLCRTNCAGLFAAGDVTDIPYNQISIAAGMGATAGLAAIDYINHWSE